MAWDTECVTTQFMHRCWCTCFPSPEELVQKWRYDFQVNAGEDLFHIFDNLQHNYGLIYIIQLSLYLSLGQRGWENESVQIIRVKHNCLVILNFWHNPSRLFLEWPLGHQGHSYSTHTRTLCSLQSWPDQVWYSYPEKRSCNLTSSVRLNWEWICWAAAGLFSA